jgi:hypothetical protein
MNLDNIGNYVWDCVQRHTNRPAYNNSWHCVVNSVWFRIQSSVYDATSPSVYAPVRDSVRRQYESK